MQGFLRSLRSIYPAPIRFYGVGEYGDRTFRPHFHLALFGVSVLDGEYIGKAWKKGFFHLGDLTRDSAQYLCGYVTKKLNKKDDVLLQGRHPEFARMSLRPGIGALAIRTLKGALAPNGDLTTLVERGDVPETMRTGGKVYPLGRYLRGKLRESIGWEPTQPERIKKAFADAYVARTPEEVRLNEVKRDTQYTRAHARQKIDRSKKRL